MKRSGLFTFAIVFWISCLFLLPLPAQVTRSDYERAANLRNELQPLALNMPERPSWIDNTSRFWYRKTVKGGFEFQVVDAASLARQPAFDHEKLAAALAQESKEKVDAMKLPFQTISFVDEGQAIQFDIDGVRWKCDLTSYTVTRIGAAERRGPGRDPMSIWVRGPAPQAASDTSYFVDTWSRVDLPTVMELRRAADGALVTQLEKTDIAELQKAGWKPPEVFVSKGRDGKTDIWGIIIRPRNFDPNRKYPVIESIYAGPQDSFVPKSFSPYNPMQSLAELGFVVVQVDGMGTSNRSKAFHDVCWKNLGDAGFPDRILWHRAVAAKYPWYDITRVGIYGNSAGGQSSLGGLLFHPEFYKVSVSSSGCHDNRMDKIWWNEQWMGWPLGPEYAAASNVENAHLLQGKLLLIVGEMDTNVDPASTMQVVNALIKANKVFDLLVIPGADHGMGGAYGERKRNDFFVHHLLGSEPPQWNLEEKP